MYFISVGAITVGSRYRTGSGSDRIQAFNTMLARSPGKLWNSRLNLASGRYRSRFCNERSGGQSVPAIS